MITILCILVYFLIGKVFAEILWNVYDSENAYKLYTYFLFPEWFGDISDAKQFGERYKKDNGPISCIDNFESDEIIVYKFTRALIWPIYFLEIIVAHFLISSPSVFFKYRNSIKQKKIAEGQDKLTELYSNKVRIESDIEELEKELGISKVAVGVYRKNK